MASFSQPPFFSSLIPINNKTRAFSSQSKNFLTFKNSKISSSNAESSSNLPENPQESQPQESEVDANKEVPLAVKLALEKAKEYKKSKSFAEREGDVSKIVQNNSSTESAEMDKKNDGFMKRDEKLASGGGNEKSPEEKQSIKKSGKKETFSSIDFMGLNFSDKKSGRGLPAGLVPLSDPFPEGDLPEVEILIGDMSKFGDPLSASKQTLIKEDDDTELYKPKVSTWGVFPRPGDISKTYGGGRTIRPGEELETEEEKAAKQARTRQLLSAYMTKIGMKIEPKLKAECQKALNDGDDLMDLGKLKEALPFYEKVMEKLVFQTELHGLAALQWSICQDSLRRANEARSMYEKLQSHPSSQVSKKARQFFSSFEAMEFMNVSSMTQTPLTTEYQSYFEAFVEDKNNYTLKETQMDEEGGFNQALPYFIFLLLPIFMVLLLAASKSH